MSDDEARLEEIINDAEMHHAAFEMFLAGYQQRIQDEVEQPSSLRDTDSHRRHLRQAFEREWKDVKPERDSS